MMNIYFKQYPSCRWGHPAVDGIFQILNRNPGLDKKNVEKIIVKTFKEAVAIKLDLPDTTEEAQYSLPYPVAAAFADGNVGPEQVSENRLHDPSVVALSQKVEFIYDPEKQKAFPAKTLAEVEVVMKNGATYSSDIMSARGDPDEPLSDQEIKDKFKSITENVLDNENADSIIDLVFNLDDTGSLNRLFQYLQ